MESEFWKKRWLTDEIGWHAPDTNKHLERFLSRLGPMTDGQTLVPLCGKSLDMDFLARQGRQVLGIELSPIASRAFFRESGRSHSERKDGHALILESEDVSIRCQDLFSLEPNELSGIEACYDRACLVALKPEQRRRYAAWIGSVMPPGSMYLLLTVEYPPAEKNGPPFTVPMDEVKELFDADFEMEVLHRADIVDDAPKYRAWGVTSLIETVYSLRRR